MASNFSGKVVIVTGSSAGLGEAIAITFASRGANVTLCGRDQGRLTSVLDKAVQVSGGHKERFLAVQGNLIDAKVREDIVKKTVEKFGRLDILVPNAGVIGAQSSFLEDTEEKYNEVFDTNLKSVFFLIQLAVPHLEMSKGNIVNISSITAHMVFISSSIYSMTKAALDHLTRCLAVDLGPKGIRVNSVNPGHFPTLILRNVVDADSVELKVAKSEREQQPLKGRIGVSEDVSEAVTFLASDAAGFITGELIIVDGGRHYGGSTVIYLKNYDTAFVLLNYLFPNIQYVFIYCQ